MVVPTVGMGVLLNRRLLFQGLEANDIGLRWCVSVDRLLTKGPRRSCLRYKVVTFLSQRCNCLRLEVVILRCLKPPHQHGPICSHLERQIERNDLRRSHIPRDV
jgi:hypothetical protein